jgi:hypothetical protein
MERSAASIKSMWARRSIVALLALVVGVFGLVAGSPRPTSAVGNPERSAPTTWASGGWFSYDGSPLHSCFAVLQDHGYLSNARATSPPAAARDRSTVPCGQVLGAPTTPHTRRNATRAGPGTAIEPMWAQAPNRGFLGGWSKAETLQPGTIIDRYGGETGRFFSPAGTPLEARALPTGSGPLNTYEVLKPLEVQGGIVAPAFGQPGLGVQYMSPQTVADLIEAGIIKPVTP